MNQQDRWIICGVDTGGTFTDMIIISNNKIEVKKIPSTPNDPKIAVMNIIRPFTFVKEVLHGTTVATNAVIQRKGAKVALITTLGFKDIIEIGRQNRDNIYALYPTRPDPLVPNDLRFEVNERIVSDGTVETDLDPNEIIQLMENFKNLEIESVAICTLFSFLNSKHEEMIADIIGEHYPISVSSLVLPEYREYERMSTTIMDAYIKPLMTQYLSSLENDLLSEKLTDMFAVMKSAYGISRGETIAKSPVNTLMSGLAAGVHAAEYTSELLHELNILSLDIGGTSTDVASIIKGKAGIQQEQKLGGLPVAVPAVDIVTIGAGGGSLVQIRSGLIQVGPESAGADPGPIAYDRGGSVLTITDINLCFGLLSSQLAGGLMLLKPILAEDAAEKMASELELTLNDFVSGVRKIFHENIASALKSVSLERGQDPRKFSLLAFGGAGPAHAVEIAELMQISKVIIPPYPGAWSAIGLIGADYSYSNSKGVVRNLDHFKLTELQSEYAKLAQVLQTEADQDRQPHFRILQKFTLMRFKGQSYELTVDFEEDIQKIRQQFLDLHVERYGFAAKDEEIEVVSLRVNLLVPHENPKLPKLQDHSKIQPFESRNIIGEPRSIPVYRKLDFASDTKFEGPLLIDQLDTTIWVPRGWNLITNEYGFLILKKQVN